MIDLYYWPTPNGKKVTILLEECGLEYKIVPVNIGRGDQFKDDFLRIGAPSSMNRSSTIPGITSRSW